MVAASSFVSAASAAVLLAESRSLASVIQSRNRQCLLLQLRMVVLLACARQAVAQLMALEWAEKLFFQVAPWLHAVAQRVLQCLRQPTGTAAVGALVPLGLAASGIPLLGATPSQQERRLRWFRAVLACGSAPTLLDALEKRFGAEVDVIAVIAFELGLLMGEHGAASIILLMLTGGEALEQYTFSRARASLACVLDESSPVAHRLLNNVLPPSSCTGRPGAGGRIAVSDDELSPSFSAPDRQISVEDIPVEAIQEWDVLAVRAGEMVPVDGRLYAPGAEGKTLSVVEESLLTGEGCDKMKSSNDPLLSGSIAKTSLWMRATATYQGSTLELMRRSLKDALERKGQVQHRSQRAASLLQPLTLVAAALSVALRRGQSPHRRWKVALSVLMAATPCPASIGVPVAFLSGMSVAAHHSVLIKSAAAIEAAAKATHIVLDKTGTLTSGSPQVLAFEVFRQGSCHPGITGEDLTKYALQVLATIEVLSSHSLASAICRYAAECNISPLRVQGTECVPGCGMFGTVDGHRVAVGTLTFLEERSLKFSGELPDNAGRRSKDNSSAVMETFFAIEDVCCGYATFEDALRPGTAAAVQQLQALGLQVSILSGDRSAHLQSVADQVGVKDARGCLLPHEKANVVKSMCSNSRSIIMVGDGSNDAPALAIADVGIAIGTQSGLASQSADVVVGSDAFSSPLARVAQLVILSRVIVGTARRGVRCGLGLSALQVAAAAAGLLAPRTNAVLQELVDVSALANAASVLRHRWQ